MDYITNYVNYIWNQIISMTVFDVIDIIIVSIIFYHIFKFVRDRRAGKLAIGILFILFVLFLSDMLNMQALNYLVAAVVQVGAIGLIIVFQSELRSFLEKVGGNPFVPLNRKLEHKSFQQTLECIDVVVDGARFFSAEKTGALIVFERGTKLGDVIRTGTLINAEPSVFLLKNIFFNKAPLHDGALIIRNNRFFSAGCFLPLSLNNDIIKDLGTRHRAAIGMSENSDCVVVVVSEETGTISIALDGVLTRDYDEVSLKNELLKLLIHENVTVDNVDGLKETAEKVAQPVELQHKGKK